MRKLLIRRQPKSTPLKSVLAGLGGMIAIFFVIWLTKISAYPLLMAPFGASCVLLFSVPQSPLSQPINVVGGHVISAGIGLIVLALLPDFWWAPALAVGLAIFLMALLRVTHPPAGANPLVVFALQPGASYLIFPVLSGAVLLVVIAMLFHKTTQTPYPHTAG